MSSETLYLKISQITEVYEPDVYVKDIAEVHCQDKAAEAKIKAVKVTSFPQGKKRSQSYVGNVVELAKKIEQAQKNVEINSVGESDFIVTYRAVPYPPKAWEWVKTIFVAAVAFCGAAFAIMTFNNDSSVTDVFANLYQLAMGSGAQESMVLETSYSIGLAFGILVFFNHFAHWKITVDPTPIEVEMRLYEENLNKALIQNDGRKEAGVDVS